MRGHYGNERVLAEARSPFVGAVTDSAVEAALVQLSDVTARVKKIEHVQRVDSVPVWIMLGMVTTLWLHSLRS